MSGTSDPSGRFGADPAATRGYRMDPYTRAVRMDAGMAAARTVRTLAFAGVAARLFAIYASAHRVSVSQTFLDAIGADGRIDITERPDALSLVSRARDADSTVTVAFIVVVSTFVLYIIALIALAVRAKRGDALARSVTSSRAIRNAQRLYLLAAIGAVALTNLYKPSSDAPPRERLDDLMGQDVGNICVQLLVIAFLLILGLTVNRKIDAAYTDTRNIERIVSNSA